jgi:acyl carrier protein
MADVAAIIGKALGVDPATLTDDSSPKTVAKWDSMRAVVLLTALERAFSVRFSHAEFDEMDNVGRIKQVLRRHGRL